MNLFQTTDHHIKDEEPFFQAGKALDEWLFQFFKNQDETFVYLDSGDRFHTSKETGRVNGEVVDFFTRVSELPNCNSVIVLQGNHDYRSDTGSALDIISHLPKVLLIKKPTFLKLPQQKETSYFLPHMGIDPSINFHGKYSYGREEFHSSYWGEKEEKSIWETKKPQIEFCSAHLGDQTTGEFFMDTDISFIPGVHSHGHIHKTVSKTHLESASITRRDEANKKCIMRKFNTKDFSYEEIELPIFLNYASVPYGVDIIESMKESKTICPETSLILDIFGHDDEDFVRKEYSEKIKDLESPKIYLGNIYPVERRSEAVSESGEELEISSENLTSLMEDFCLEKGLSDSLKLQLLKRVS